LDNIIEILSDKNIEQMMNELDLFCQIIDVFDNESQLKNKIKTLKDNLKNNLIKAIKEEHPDSIYCVDDRQIVFCKQFLSEYLDNGKVFSTNYDLLLYWVLMKDNGICKDGFGRECEDDGTYSDLKYGLNRKQQQIFYLHGALHLFECNSDIIKQECTKCTLDKNTLIKNITNRMNIGAYPIFVSAGNYKDKMKQIRHNYYLSSCYDALSEITGALITYGFSFNVCDEHIISAINKAKQHGLSDIYIGVYSETDRFYIESIKDKFKCKVHLFNSKTINIWGDQINS
ncbi:MAG: DUF4917 family protein, partial [Spirochaetales bacterium]|nr:DUF4917 family protein [Spirochaetales bacterium]